MRKPGDTDGPGPLSSLEREVLQRVLARDDPALEALRGQALVATVSGRTFSGVGFMTRLAVPDAMPAASGDAAPRLRPLLARHPALAEPVEFMLQVRAGRLATLEAFCGDGCWPDDEAAFRLVG
jgi:hypothetical protein